jgi:3-dehydroquinate synthase
LGIPFWDLDHEIEARTRRKIPQIFQKRGEVGFRKIEQKILSGFFNREEKVVSLGGGALLDESSRRQAEAWGQVLVLQADYESILERLSSDDNERPLLNGDLPKRLEILLQTRKPHYDSFPLKLDVTEGSIENLVWHAQVKTGMFRVQGMGHPYPVRACVGKLEALGQVLRLYKLNGPIGIVTDEQVGALYAQIAKRSLTDAGYQVEIIQIPAGEAFKNIESVGQIWAGMLAAGVDRGSTMLALGGGVINDLAGFAAATLLRGIAWVTVPTTLLAMIDASLGGKTGADLPQGKNLVGAFHPPKLVYVDVELLKTLPPEEFRSGMAEVVKHGIIGDPGLYQMCSDHGLVQSPDAWETLVRRAMAVKIQVIQQDPFESGWRAALNLGHTVGHAVEAASNFRLRHGEAVAIGMVIAARLAGRLGICQPGLADEFIRVLTGLELPVEIPSDLPRDEIWKKMKVDKKRREGEIRFVLPVRIGEVKVGQIVDEDTLRQEGL